MTNNKKNGGEKKLKTNNARKVLVALTTLLMASLLVSFAHADTSGTSTGTATVTSPPPTVSVTDCNLYDSTGATVKNNTSLDSNNLEYWINFTVAENNTMADLHNVTIIAWDNRGQAVTDADSQRYHYTWTWVESTDTWACPLSASYINQTSCLDPGTASADTSYTFQLGFKLSKVANYSNGGVYDGWQFNITAYDDAGNVGTFGNGTGGRIQFGVASYLSITITDAAHTWSGEPGTSDKAVAAGGDGKVDFTVLANRVWKAQVKGGGDLTKGGGGIIGLDNVTQYGSDSVGDSVSLTTEFADVTGITSQAAPSDEASPAEVGVYLWLDIPAATPSGDYVYTLTVQVAT